MGHRIYSAVVVLFWSSTMTWLLVAKILPPFWYDKPPHQISETEETPVVWQVFWQDRPVGWAASQSVPGTFGTVEQHSRFVLEEIPVRDMVPRMMAAVVEPLGELKLDCRTITTLDSLGNFSGFETKVRINDLQEVSRISGIVEDGQLKLEIKSGIISHESSIAMPDANIIGKELIPDGTLRQLYIGRKWQRKLYSPIRVPQSSIEAVNAEVVSKEALQIHGEIQTTFRVEYHSAPLPGVATKNNLVAVLWVSESGVVLRQNLHLMNAEIRFDRAMGEQAVARGDAMLELGTYATSRGPNAK